MAVSKLTWTYPETTIVSGERYICARPGGPIRYPDLLVAFDADPELYETNNGYVVSFQGKPPELALEVASRHTWRTDIEVKPDFYASLGVQEYWRFDETGEFHGARLAGDRLVDGQYHPIVVDELADGELRGYSETLGLYFCWRQERLDWYDPSDRGVHPKPGVRAPVTPAGGRKSTPTGSRTASAWLTEKIAKLEDHLHCD